MQKPQETAGLRRNRRILQKPVCPIPHGPSLSRACHEECPDLRSVYTMRVPSGSRSCVSTARATRPGALCCSSHPCRKRRGPEIRGRHGWGGGKKRGEENKGVLDTPSYGTFSTPLRCQCSVFLVQKIRDRAEQKLFWRGPKIFGRARSLVRFPSQTGDVMRAVVSI